MNQKSDISISLPFTALIVCLQTAISILPGLLILQNIEYTSISLLSFICYLFFSEFFQYFARVAYKNGKFISKGAYITKLIICSSLILLIANKTVFQYGLILIGYEAFQFLNYSRQFHYIDTFAYTFVNAFFKGIVFNQLISITYPFNFKLDLMTPFILSFALLLLLTILTQGFYSYLAKFRSYLFFSSCLLISIYGYLTYLLLFQNFSWVKFFLLAFVGIVALSFFFKAKQAKKKEFIASLFVFFTLLIFYFPI